MSKMLMEQDRRRFSRLARRGFIPAGAVGAFVNLAASARSARAACGSEAMVLEGIIEMCTRSTIENWIGGRYR